MRLAGFSYLSWQDYQNSRALKKGDKGEYRILCLGDSMTAFGGEDSYPKQLERILNRHFPNRPIAVINRGIPGANTEVVLANLRYNINKYGPDMIIVMIGINDESEIPADRGFISGFKNFIKKWQSYKLAKLLYDRMRSRQVLKKMYLERGSVYLELQRYYEAQQMFNKARELDASDAMAYVWLGKCYLDWGRPVQSEDMFNKAQILALDDVYAYVELGWGYYDMRDFRKAEEMFLKALSLRADDYDLYVEAGQFYQAVKSLDKAEDMFKQAVRLTGLDDSWPFSSLGWHYFERGILDKAQEMFAKALEIKQDDPGLYKDLAYVKDALGLKEEAGMYFNRAAIMYEYSRNIAVRNYNILKEINLKRNIGLVCAQYPGRGVNELKEMFNSTDGVIFVDNEKSFKEALAKGRYEDYFVDRFAGDFGHCTPEGNNLLASAVAEAVIKAGFGGQRLQDNNVK